MKKDVPIWAAVLGAVVVFALVGWFMWNQVNSQYGEKVVPQVYGDNSNPFGNAGPTGTAPSASSEKQ